MNHYRLSEAARSDLDDIWLFIALDNLTAADRFVEGNAAYPYGQSAGAEAPG